MTSSISDQSSEQETQQQYSDYTPDLEADPEQKQQQQHTGLPVLLGITNLYFIKMLPNWPNVVAVSKKEAVRCVAAAKGACACVSWC